ncbi:MAG: GNAT family N-acetyltransferase [Anaerolineae bacterium]|nr:GNAT family N-acetyltransferase [Anaerolineae bacterium]
MKDFPTLETERLRLRRFELADAPIVQTLLNDPDVTGNLLEASLPFSLEDACSMITTSHATFEAGTGWAFAVTRKSNDDLVGYCDIQLQCEHQRGAITYWIGRPYWWQGYATEAAKKVVRFGYEQLGLNRIYAYVLQRNTASAHVLQKAGLIREGTLRQSILKAGVFEDVDFYALLREDWLTEG